MSNLTLQEQIDNIVNELKDLRRSHHGITYGKGGANIRNVGVLARNAGNQVTKLGDRVSVVEMDVDYLRNNLEELVSAAGVDGLEYKNNTLFLKKGDDLVLPGVRIVSGSGGGAGDGVVPSNMTVRIEMLNDSNTLNISGAQDAELKFKFTSLDAGEPTGKCSCTIYRNGIAKDTFSINNGEEIPRNVKDFLTVGRNEISVECSDIYGNKKQLQYVINVISLEITSTFNGSEPIVDDTFDFIYTQSGDIDKQVHFIIGSGTSENHIVQNLSKDADKQQIQSLPSPVGHGAHLLEVYMTGVIGDNDIESNHLKYELIFPKDNVSTPIIASHFDITKVKQGTLLSIPFIVYDPDSPQCNITLQTSYNKGGELITSSTYRVVDQKRQTWDIRNLPVGIVKFSIIYEKLGQIYKKEHQVEIIKSDIKVEPASSGLQLVLSSEGRSNANNDYDSWTYGDFSTTFSGFNWGTNGWLPDDNKDTCLRLNGDAQIEIDFKPFDTDFKASGKTLEFEFAIRNVNNRDAVVIDCFDADGNEVGIQATADKMFFNSNNDTVFCNYTENQRVRVGFTVQSNTQNRFMCVYLNGVLSGIKQYAEGDSFQQSNRKTIKIGSPDCGIDLYAIRSYGLCLTDEQMIDNYIADIPNIIDKMDIYGDNDIYENGKISYKKVKKKIPTVTFIGKMPTYKGDKKKNSVRMIFEHPTKRELNFDEILAQIDVQGTSSAGYVRKNWKTKHNREHTHMEGELPAKVFCLKVDYAEATGTHNTQNANLIEAFYDDYPIPPLNVPEGTDLSGRNLSSLKDINKVRTTISGFPICIFHLDTDDSELIRSATVATLESGEYPVVFSSKGNFNYDKGAEDVFAFNNDYDVECWEFLKNEDPQSFLTPWPEKPLDYWEARYHKDLGDLEDLQEKGNNQAVYDLGNKMLVRFKEMYEWVHSTARGKYNGVDQASGAALEHTYTDSLNNQYTHDTDEYRLAKFRDEFENYFNLDYCAIYYVYTFFALMVDQRAKNMFLTYWRDNAYGPNDETNLGHWYPYFYDNDTSYGISNKGHLDFDYYHQDTDTVNGTNVYNGANSVLWCNFRDAFASKIASTYAKLRSDNKISYNKIIDQFVNQGSDMWSAAIYNADADYKYVSVSQDEVDGVTTDYPYLFQVRGNGEQHLEYFVDNRIKFCDSKWKCGDYLNDKTHTASVTIYNPTTGTDYQECLKWDETKEGDKPAYYETYQKIKASAALRPPTSKISLTPFSRMYYAVQYGRPSGNDPTQGMISKLALDTTTPLEFTHSTSTNLNDFETTIFGARDISSLGDLSHLYPKQVIISNCIKLTDLEIGCRELGPNGEQYFNPNLHTVSTGANTLLRTIDVSNCPNLKGNLELGGCINIKEVYAKGSGITSVSLPEGGYINKLVLPQSFNNLILKGQKYLTNEGIELDDFTSLNQLTIDNCPRLDVCDLLERCKDGDNYTLQYMRLTNVDLGTVTYDYIMNKLAHIGGINDNNVLTDVAYIQGKCRINNIDGQQLAKIKRVFPYLVVYYDSLNLNVTFKDEAGRTTLYGPLPMEFTSGNSSQGVTIDDPVSAQEIEVPQKAATTQYYFNFGGWAKNPNSDPDPTALLGISEDTTLYASFNKTLRSYPVRFRVKGADPVVVDTAYGYTAVYPGDPRDKLTGVSNPYIYSFIGWTPQPVIGENITEAGLDCYAQFTINEESEDFSDYELTEFDYTLDESQKTITLNKANVIENTGRIKDSYNLGENYTVTKITGITLLQDSRPTYVGCFSENTEARRAGIIEGTDKESQGVTHQIEYVILPDSLTTIGNHCFDSCSNLLGVNIPKNVSTIGNYVFDRCVNLETITVDEENSNFKAENNCLINKKTNTLITGGGESCNVPDGVQVIGEHAFWGRHKLKKLKLPTSLVKIRSGALCECQALTEIDIPDNVQTFESMCFYNTGLSKIVFPENTTSIGMYATLECTKLEDIYIKQSNPDAIKIDANAFGNGNTNSKLTIHVPWSEGKVEGGAIKWGAQGAFVDYNWNGEIK